MPSDYDEIKKDVNQLKDSIQELKLEAVRAQAKVDAIRKSVAEAEKAIEKLDTTKVSVVAFNPIQKITYGVIGSILVAFLAALISLVIIPTEKKQYKPQEHLLTRPEVQYETKSRVPSP